MATKGGSVSIGTSGRDQNEDAQGGYHKYRWCNSGGDRRSPPVGSFMSAWTRGDGRGLCDSAIVEGEGGVDYEGGRSGWGGRRRGWGSLGVLRASAEDGGLLVSWNVVSDVPAEGDASADGLLGGKVGDE